MRWDRQMFAHRRELVQKVLEIGVGTKASMGENYRPGSSLRMWRDFFPNAEIYGLDVDRSVLFVDERIPGFFCDQGN
jgi:hypothetical protein